MGLADHDAVFGIFILHRIKAPACAKVLVFAESRRHPGYKSAVPR